MMITLFQQDGGKRNKIIVNKNTLFIDYLNQYVSVIIFNDCSISIYEIKPPFKYVQ